MAGNVLERVRAFVLRDSYYLKVAVITSIPPGLLICLIASDGWLSHFGTTSYLAPVIAACALPTLPRAKLIRFDVQLILVFAISYAYSLLAGWCGLQARHHTQPSNASGDDYNGSAEAVVVIYFIFYFWLVFTIKSAFTSWALPTVLAGLYTAAVLPVVATASSMGDIVKTTTVAFEACLAGVAVASATGLILSRGTCRKSFSDSLRNSVQCVVNLTRMHAELLAGATASDDYDGFASRENLLVGQIKDSLPKFLANAAAVKENWALAKQEVGWSKIDNDGLDRLQEGIASLTPLLSGIVSTTEMLHVAREREMTRHVGEDSDGVSDKPPSETEGWHQIRREMQAHSLALANDCLRSAEDALHQVQEFDSSWLPTTKKKPEIVEKREEEGSVHDDSHDRIGPASSDPPSLHSSAGHRSGDKESLVKRFREGGRLLRPLKPEQQHISAVHYFMVMNEQVVLDETRSKLQAMLKSVSAVAENPKRLRLPSKGLLTNSSKAFHKPQNKEKGRVDAELRAHNATAGLKYRLVHVLDQLFYSRHAAFGLRGACAMMSIGITAFLSSSTTFYFEQRLLWALYAILLSLNNTAGSSAQSLFLRFAGTVASMLASYVVWYVPDQHTAGIMVLLWVWFAVLGYFYAKFPKSQGSWFVALIAAIVMVGNELQVQLLGATAVEAAGQAVYKPYILFPYRLAIVTLGILLAYFWNIFPAPLTEHRQLRLYLASGMVSLARLHLAISENVKQRFFGDGVNGPPADLRGVRNAQSAHYASFQIAGAGAKSLFKFLDWDIVGRKLIRKDVAAEILERTERLANHMSLVASVASCSFQRKAEAVAPDGEARSTLMPHLCPKGVAFVLVDLGNALAKGYPLAPDHPELGVPDIVDFIGLECPSNNTFASAALIHAANWYMIQELTAVTKLVTDVVGTLDYEV